MIDGNVKRSVDALAKTERVELETYLRAKNLSENKDFREEIARRAKQVQSGEFISADEIKNIDKMLSEQGL